mmetsp:Transcript_19450/g.65714  ORF Transcript_19450/g.65714 Transcript_19450/m.65714 type:complete len:410 (+) Transcript_19450:569-1798(+)
MGAARAAAAVLLRDVEVLVRGPEIFSSAVPRPRARAGAARRALCCAGRLRRRGFKWRMLRRENGVDGEGGLQSPTEHPRPNRGAARRGVRRPLGGSPRLCLPRRRPHRAQEPRRGPFGSRLRAGARARGRSAERRRAQRGHVLGLLRRPRRRTLREARGRQARSETLRGRMLRRLGRARRGGYPSRGSRAPPRAVHAVRRRRRQRAPRLADVRRAHALRGVVRRGAALPAPRLAAGPQSRRELSAPGRRRVERLGGGRLLGLQLLGPGVGGGGVGGRVRRRQRRVFGPGAFGPCAVARRTRPIARRPAACANGPLRRFAAGAAGPQSAHQRRLLAPRHGLRFCAAAGRGRLGGAFDSIFSSRRCRLQGRSRATLRAVRRRRCLGRFQGRRRRFRTYSLGSTFEVAGVFD